jgi:hypothetical protein
VDTIIRGGRARPKGGLRRRLMHGGTALVILSLAGTTAVSAATPLDFGTVSVGAVKSLSATVPLQASLSELAPETVLYPGGNPTIDLALSLSGLSVPLTAGALYSVTGEVTVTYHLSGSLATGTDFSVDAAGCATGTGSCNATVTFAPTAAGVRTDTLHWSSSDVVITGGGTLGAMVQLLASFLADSFEDQLTIDLSGIGVPSSGTVAAQVEIAASAACVELSTAAIDFGNLSLGAEDAPATPTITITNCSGVGESLFAAATDANGTSSHWSLVDSSATCANTLGVDNYRLSLASPSLAAPLSLSTSNKAVQSLASAQAVDHTARIFTACPGSTGAGRVMTMFINYLVTGE